MKRERFPAVALFAAVFLGAPCARQLDAGDRPAPAYTDDDLARVRPLRAETGVLSAPAFAPETAPRRATADAHGEAYWRKQADRLTEQLRPLRREADELRRQIREAASRPEPPRTSSSGSRRDSQRHQAPVPRRSTPDPRRLQERLRAIEQELREREAHLEDDARREGALPGWIR
jgi:hypothetical protein